MMTYCSTCGTRTTEREAARDELTESLRDLVERVIDTGKEMTLTVVVNIEPGSVLVGSIEMPNEVAFEIGAGRPRSGGAA